MGVVKDKDKNILVQDDNNKDQLWEYFDELVDGEQEKYFRRHNNYCLR